MYSFTTYETPDEFLSGIGRNVTDCRWRIRPRLRGMVHHGDQIAPLEQSDGELGTNKSQPSGDQDLHGSSSLDFNNCRSVTDFSPPR